MKIDIVTIFPDYFAPLHLSLVGKAIERGDVVPGVRDLRDWTHDRHRTVDDTPYGGGAGMVMKPEPWGEALDELTSVSTPILIVPTPSGELFDQHLAQELSLMPHLLFACGRYEGIDARVIEYARTRMPVREISLGNFVLNGGEVAVLAMIEAIVRLLPGVLGNPESLAEESYSVQLDGLLEYPNYTKPASWRGFDVPDVLLSGHHQRIAQWRLAKSRERTQRVRPDLFDRSKAVTDVPPLDNCPPAPC